MCLLLCVYVLFPIYVLHSTDRPTDQLCYNNMLELRFAK